MAYNIFGGQTYNLSGSISSTATSITLSSFLLPVTLEEITMSLLNTDIVYATIAPKTTSSEFISFTGITQNANGTATLTGVVRGLNKTYPFTSDASFKLPHSGQSQFIISDAPQLFKKFGTLANDEVITGQWEAPNPNTAQGLVTNQYMLDLINGGAVTFNSVTEAGTAGETLVAGDLVYFSEVDNEWLKTDADTLATVFNVKLGIAQGSGTNGNPISGGVLTYGTYTTSGLTQGDLCYASNTAGGINSGTAGTTPRVIGIAKSSTVLYFDPYFENFLYNYGVDTIGTDAYAVTLAGAYSAYYPGMLVSFKAGAANTGASTLAINGGSAKAIKKSVSSDLETGDILLNQIVTVQYDGTNFQLLSISSLTNGLLLSNGSDGDLTITSGATNIDLTSQNIVVKQYNNISITGTGSLTFSNPNSAGTSIILLCKSFTCTSSTSPAIVASSLGASGGAGATYAAAGGSGAQNRDGNNGTAGLGIANYTANFGALGSGTTAGALGGAVPTIRTFGSSVSAYFQGLLPWLLPGAGGGSGGAHWTNAAASQNITTGGGGRGGAALAIISSGTWNFTAVISVAGGDAVVGVVSNLSGAAMVGGGGGGGGGVFYGLWKSLVANSGTITTTAGTGGTSLGDNTAGSTAGAGGAGGVSAGSNGSAQLTGVKSGGDGGAGLEIRSQMY